MGGVYAKVDLAQRRARCKVQVDRLVRSPAKTQATDGTKSENYADRWPARILTFELFFSSNCVCVFQKNICTIRQCLYCQRSDSHFSESCPEPASAEVPDDFAALSLLDVGEAAGCEENHDTDKEAHDIELDDGRTEEFAVGKVRGTSVGLCKAHISARSVRRSERQHQHVSLRVCAQVDMK